jgi:competence protein ComEC
MKFSTVVLTYVVYFLLKLGFVLCCSNRDGVLSVRVLDVGQGDAILITTPNRHLVLVDGGDNFEVDSYLDREMPLQNCYLDVVVLTHPHSDHLLGLQRVVQRCEVGLILYNPVAYGSELFANWESTVADFNIHSAILGDSFVVDDVAFSVLWPSVEFLDDYSDNVNNVSVVLLLDFLDFEALLTGDAEKEVWLRLDANALLAFVEGDFDFFKVAHHGADNGFYKPFLAKLNPKYAAISVGINNKFGHPNKEVIEFFDGLCAKWGEGKCLYRTDLDGTVEVVYKKEKTGQ